jgi:hypothetical protein
MPICEICGSLGAIERIYKNTINLNDDTVEVDCHYTECLICGCDYVTPEQLTLNKEIVEKY